MFYLTQLQSYLLLFVHVVCLLMGFNADGIIELVKPWRSVHPGYVTSNYLFLLKWFILIIILMSLFPPVRWHVPLVKGSKWVLSHEDIKTNKWFD